MDNTAKAKSVQPDKSRLAWGVHEIAAEIERSHRQSHYLLTKGEIKSARKVGGRWVAARDALRRVVTLPKSKEELAEAEAGITWLRSLTGRSCGSCSMCCKVLLIEDTQKPANQWCQHCTKGNGCAIYSTRPDVCRGFAYFWLVTGWMPEYWYPKKSKIVVHMRKTGSGRFLYIEVDASAPNRWREEPYWTDIKEMSLMGLTQEPFYGTEVVAGERRWIVSPDECAERLPSTQFHLVEPSPSGWRVTQFDSEEKFAAHVASTPRRGMPRTIGPDTAAMIQRMKMNSE
jgi:hypothetical protein